MATLEVTATNVRRQFANILETVEAGGRVIVTRHGQAVAAFIGPSDVAALGIEKTTVQPEPALAD